MNCGPTWERNGSSNGSGSRSLATPARLWGWTSEPAPKQQHDGWGPPFRQCTDSVRSVIPISGRPMRRYSRPNAIERSAKTAAKPTILNAATTRCANAVVGWSAKPSRSRKSWPIILVRFGTLSITITLSNAPNATSLLLHDYQPVKRWTACIAKVAFPESAACTSCAPSGCTVAGSTAPVRVVLPPCGRCNGFRHTVHAWLSLGVIL